MARDVFISYQQEDRPAAERLRSKLEERKISCWIAPRDIDPGQEWATGIVEGLRRCHSFVLILSAHSASSKQVAREVELADHCGLKIIALRLEDVKPSPSLLYFLGNVQWLDACPDRFEQAIDRLEEAIHKSGSHPAAATVSRRAHHGKPEPSGRSSRRLTPLVGKMAVGALLAAGLGTASYIKIEKVRAQRAYQEGEKEFASNRLGEALASFNLAISLDRNLYVAYCRRAMVRHQMKQENLALKDINAALQLSHSWTLAFRVRGDIENRLEQYDLAIRDYTAAIAINTPDPRGISNVGLAYEGRARARRALGENDLAEQDEAAANALCGSGRTASRDPAVACG